MDFPIQVFNFILQSANLKALMRDAINARIKDPAQCKIEHLEYTTSIFKRGEKPKKFTETEVRRIMRDPRSVAYKATYYGASETTIRKIMKGRY